MALHIFKVVVLFFYEVLFQNNLKTYPQRRRALGRVCFHFFWKSTPCFNEILKIRISIIQGSLTGLLQSVFCYYCRYLGQGGGRALRLEGPMFCHLAAPPNYWNFENPESVPVWKYGFAYVHRCLKNGVLFQANLKTYPGAAFGDAPGRGGALGRGYVFKWFWKSTPFFKIFENLQSHTARLQGFQNFNNYEGTQDGTYVLFTAIWQLILSMYLLACTQRKRTCADWCEH